MEKFSGTIANEGIIFGQLNVQDDMSCFLTTDVEVTGNIVDTILKGYSAYELAIKNGFVGTEQEWLASLHGKPVYVRVLVEMDDVYILEFYDDDKTLFKTPNLKGPAGKPSPSAKFEDSIQINKTVLNEETLKKLILIAEKYDLDELLNS